MAATAETHRPGLDTGRPDLALRAVTLGYLGLMVVLPLLALGVQSVSAGPQAFWKALGDPHAVHALQLTVTTALAMVAINIVMGTATAWVLVRYDFPGKGLMNALIDLPFAVPTIVTGLMLVLLYGPSSVLGTILGRYGFSVVYAQPGIVLALLFVSYPFVIRSVQPVLLELDRAEEEAAATMGASPWLTFRRVTLPTLLPAILTGAALSFSRALGEFGSVIMVAGNQPMNTKTAPLYVFGEIESGNRLGAMAVSVVLLAVSLGVLMLLNLYQKHGRPEHGD
jgi:sulfate transport system permease protein